jgi:Mce-associated membrane protein
MSTTRHLVNRQRRLANAGAARVAATETPPERGKRSSHAPHGTNLLKGRGSSEAKNPSLSSRTRPASLRAATKRSLGGLRRLVSVRAPVVLCILVVLLGAFGALAATRADSLRSDPAARNAALTDPARTSEVKGQTAKAVAALFSYNYADTAPADKAASTLLTGKAVQQHRDMLAAVRAQAKGQKLVLTTSVTESGVEMIDGSRARVLVYADQSSTRTAGKKPETTYAAAMFTVDMVRGSGAAWQISGIDTFGQGS